MGGLKARQVRQVEHEPLGQQRHTALVARPGDTGLFGLAASELDGGGTLG